MQEVRSSSPTSKFDSKLNHLNIDQNIPENVTIYCGQQLFKQNDWKSPVSFRTLQRENIVMVRINDFSNNSSNNFWNFAVVKEFFTVTVKRVLSKSPNYWCVTGGGVFDVVTTYLMSSHISGWKFDLCYITRHTWKTWVDTCFCN